LDMIGDLTLTHGPAGTSAGPYDVVKGTTLAPGATGTVIVSPPPELANGPWTARLHLSSGLVQHDATATITFPAAGRPPNIFTTLFAGDNTARTAGVLAAIAILIVGGFLLLVWRSRRQRAM
jgi:hypothetical protein